MGASLWAGELTRNYAGTWKPQWSNCNFDGSLRMAQGQLVDSWTGAVPGLVKLGSASPDANWLTYTGPPEGGWFGGAVAALN